VAEWVWLACARYIQQGIQPLISRFCRGRSTRLCLARSRAHNVGVGVIIMAKFFEPLVIGAKFKEAPSSYMGSTASHGDVMSLFLRVPIS
jgi:hypothetical protein